MDSVIDPKKPLIFRIVHIDNVPWILDHGMHCRNSKTFVPNYRTIGNADLIDKRSRRVVPISPGGTLSDYLAFYFTPYSIMMYNIKTGYGGIKQVPNEEIVVLVSSLPRLAELGIPFVFTDRHAYLASAQFSSSLDDLGRIDWGILQARDFKKDPDDPGKKERYQAEVLVHGLLPIDALLRIGCYNDATKSTVANALDSRDIGLNAEVLRDWYF